MHAQIRFLLAVPQSLGHFSRLPAENEYVRNITYTQIHIQCAGTEFNVSEHTMQAIATILPMNQSFAANVLAQAKTQGHGEGELLLSISTLFIQVCRVSLQGVRGDLCVSEAGYYCKLSGLNTVDGISVTIPALRLS